MSVEGLRLASDQAARWRLSVTLALAVFVVVLDDNMEIARVLVAGEVRVAA